MVFGSEWSMCMSRSFCPVRALFVSIVSVGRNQRTESTAELRKPFLVPLRLPLDTLNYELQRVRKASLFPTPIAGTTQLFNNAMNTISAYSSWEGPI
jgi:hypothetical protein